MTNDGLATSKRPASFWTAQGQPAYILQMHGQPHISMAGFWCIASEDPPLAPPIEGRTHREQPLGTTTGPRLQFYVEEMGLGIGKPTIEMQFLRWIDDHEYILQSHQAELDCHKREASDLIRHIGAPLACQGNDLPPQGIQERATQSLIFTRLESGMGGNAQNNCEVRVIILGIKIHLTPATGAIYLLSTHGLHQPIGGSWAARTTAKHKLGRSGPTSLPRSGRPRPATLHMTTNLPPYTLLEYGQPNPSTFEPATHPRRASLSSPCSNGSFCASTVG
uniref:Uncharacterized protein n=1 Tax=Cannabis sativa TaxID=3483 RepID=A0A803QQF8_CANSA